MTAARAFHIHGVTTTLSCLYAVSAHFTVLLTDYSKPVFFGFRLGATAEAHR
ncbi:hypothetical protein [Acetobacter musti]|uniref:hypothetical protein n=1 Tax=Acetobacter musti TaxID=864732 RepID=UPI00156B62FB|nr:hypothetical protein [Acetobacter musti]